MVLRRTGENKEMELESWNGWGLDGGQDTVLGSAFTWHWLAHPGITHSSM
jgi:hypothetical protein